VGAVWGVIAGLMGGLAVGLPLGLLGGGSERERVVGGSPRQAIRSSGQLGLAFGLLVAVAVGLNGGLAYGLAYGLAFGLAAWLGFGFVFGLDAIAFHYAFCVWLRMHDLGPRNWARFLQWASDRLLLRTNGISYQWVHLELRDYLGPVENTDTS